MRIVEVQFIKDSQCVQTGNEFYPSGASAHFYANQADWLVGQGWAVINGETPKVAENPPSPTPSFDEMTVSQLRVYAYANGVKSPTKMRKADLIAALEE